MASSKKNKKGSLRRSAEDAELSSAGNTSVSYSEKTGSSSEVNSDDYTPKEIKSKTAAKTGSKKSTRQPPPKKVKASDKNASDSDGKKFGTTNYLESNFLEPDGTFKAITTNKKKHNTSRGKLSSDLFEPPSADLAEDKNAKGDHQSLASSSGLSGILCVIPALEIYLKQLLKFASRHYRRSVLQEESR